MIRIVRICCCLPLILLCSGLLHAERAPLVISQDAAWPPFAYLDEKGVPQGLLVDLWRSYGIRNGREVRFELVDWQESLDQIRNGRADLHGGLFRSDEREAYLDFSRPLFPLATRLFVASMLQVDSIGELGAIPVGITLGSYEEAYIERNHPGIQLKRYPNNRELVEAAISGGVLAFVADYPVGMYYLNKFHQPISFRVIETLYTQQLRAAVLEGEDDLLREINQGLQAMPASELERIRQKWVLSVDVEVVPAWLYPTIAVSVGALMLALLGIYTLALKKQVRLRTEDLLRANERLKAVAEKDQLTGLFNRFKLDKLLAQELRRAERYDHPLSVIMFDIDHFKRVNDNFGHQVGDQALVSLSGLIRQNLRRPDYAGRWGGEEFMVICPEIAVENARVVAEKLRKAIAIHPFPQGLKLTASFGVTAYRPGDDLTSMTRRVDAALYGAKEQGRNCTQLEG